MQVYGEGLPSRVLAMTERASQNFDNGNLIQTGRALDIAIEGDGWFAVQAPPTNFSPGATDEAYSRQGQLRLTEEGALETMNGEAVIGDNGPIIIPLPVASINISRDGTVMVQPEGAPNNAREEVARLKLVNPDVRLLEKGNDGLFRRKDGEVEVADVAVKVMNGTIESSNVNPINEMSEMIAIQRQFEMQLKLMKTAEEVDSSAAALLRAF
jgi:flagellar basal-body rod protein FlgF